MKVLIAGCGYVGCALAELLRDAGHQVAGLRRNVAALPDGIEPVAADLGVVEELRATLAGRSFDWLVYAAAADGRSEQAYRRAYVEGLSHVLDAVERPARLVFTSSTAVYGHRDGERVDEASETAPLRFTGDIMLEAEEVARSYDDAALILRFGGIYGPTRTRLIDRVRTGVAEVPSGVQMTNRIHRDDCAGVIAHLLPIASAHGDYVCVDDNPADMRDVLRWIADRLGVEAPPVSSGEPPAAGKICQNAKLKAAGYTFRFPSFRDGYGAMIDAAN